MSRRRRAATVTGLVAGLLLLVAGTQPAAADNCGDPTDCFATGESFTEALIGLAVTTVMSLLMFTLVGRLLALFGMLAARLALVASLGRFGLVGRFFGFGLPAVRGSAAFRSVQAARAASQAHRSSGVGAQVRPGVRSRQAIARPSAPPPRGANVPPPERPPAPGQLPPGLRRPDLPPELRPPVKSPGPFERLPDRVPPHEQIPGVVARQPERELPNVDFPGTPGSGLPKSGRGKAVDVAGSVLKIVLDILQKTHLGG